MSAPEVGQDVTTGAVVGTYDGVDKTLDDLRMDYRKELIEVMAVALSAIQDFQTGEAKLDEREMWFIFQDVIQERNRQNEKWGAQHHDFGGWVVILAEEMGEVAKAAMRAEWAEVQEIDGGN